MKVRPCLLFVGFACALLAACPAGSGGGAVGRGPKAPKPVAPGTGAGAANAQPDPVGPAHSPPTQAGTPLLEPAGASCTAAPCAFHVGSAGYFHCLAGGAGACFHFGSPCQPADACMFDPTDRAYKRCSDVVEGRCQRYGAVCEPQGSCWYRPDDRLYRECLQRKPGGCARWGELCAPATPSI